MDGNHLQVLILIPKLDLRTAPTNFDSEVIRLSAIGYHPSLPAYRL